MNRLETVSNSDLEGINFTNYHDNQQSTQNFQLSDASQNQFPIITNEIYKTEESKAAVKDTAKEEITSEENRKSYLKVYVYLAFDSEKNLILQMVFK
jgi:hypothetical protein